MIKLFPRICALILIVIGTTAICHARTAYVSDMLILTFRKGPGPGYPVISALKSDTPLTILEESNGYLKVELSSGEQGWVDKDYVVTDPPKSILIDRLKKENAALEDKIKTLTEQTDLVALDQLKKKNRTLTQSLETLKSQYAALKTASADIADTLEENKRLKTRNASLSTALAQQKEDTGFMFKTGMIKWFLAGVGVLLLGWVIGLSVSSRQTGSGSLLD
ncbi:TIGR04211 family SH3 domain-containing protein [Desulfobacter latus]|uniref:TIGR04211 family SH3 domain-containing protein n=1 Tax=Desulfobacter latus TaxID=2292 RepID=A0A850T4W5_9BACT|nr:TIGR04211 family SH3 domain-containing protein [Desulfobacter latus]NWH04322.1 TIGR04211 family SH3 domain-containing protein [Desulfobacter latus]